jgi:trimethylamine:corrinoid methyltransferase-like protein
MKLARLEVLSESEVKQIHQHTLEILENTGIRVALKKMRELLADSGCKVDETSKIVRFPPAMGGVNYITCVGTLESTNLGAHELAVIDNEIIGRVERALSGIKVNETMLAFDDIQRVGAGGNYLMEPFTLEHFKSEHFIPSVSERNQIEAWKESGRKNIVDHAAAEVDRILTEHRPKVLDPKLKEELDTYVEMVKQRKIEDFENAEWES